MKKEDFKTPQCKKFSGYKPCTEYTNCLEDGCQLDTNENRIGKKILIVSLDALGNVLLNTSILKSLKEKYSESSIYWITQENAKNILYNNPYIDHLFGWNDESRIVLRNIEFDLLMNSDKSVYACAFANEVNAKQKLGFLLNKDGKIIPSNESAMYNYRMGINDKLKFRENIKTGSQIIHETFELSYKRSEYIYNFTEEEKSFLNDYKIQIKHNPEKIYVGFNTGCSKLFPNKKMTIEQHIKLIKEFLKTKDIRIVLLGGKEDTERNLDIYESFDKKTQKEILYTPTNLGIRNGACFMDICDVVVTGDSFGMHLAIALKKYVIAWFGLSCWTEIDLFDRGEKLIPENLSCAPCWKKTCPHNIECIDMIDLNRICDLVKKFMLMKFVSNYKS